MSKPLLPGPQFPSGRVTSRSSQAAWVTAAALALAGLACGGGGGPKTSGGAGAAASSGSAGGGSAGATGGAGSAGVAGATGGSGVAGAMGGTGGAAAAGSGGAAGSAGSAGAMGSAGAGGPGGASSAGAGGAAAGGVDAGRDATKDASPGAATDAAPGPFALMSSAFTEGMEIPLMYKCAQVPPVGMNVSPPLSWTAGPPGTKSYAVTLNHVASGSAHWALWDIPLKTTSLSPNVEHVASPPDPAGSRQATQNLDGFTGLGYLGPCPQAVNARQMYRFTVWAIGTETLSGVTSASTTVAAQTAIKNAAVANGSATLTGTQIQTP